MNKLEENRSKQVQHFRECLSNLVKAKINEIDHDIILLISLASTVSFAVSIFGPETARTFLKEHIDDMIAITKK